MLKQETIINADHAHKICTTT